MSHGIGGGSDKITSAKPGTIASATRRRSPAIAAVAWDGAGPAPLTLQSSIMMTDDTTKGGNPSGPEDSDTLHRRHRRRSGRGYRALCAGRYGIRDRPERQALGGAALGARKVRQPRPQGGQPPPRWSRRG